MAEHHKSENKVHEHSHHHHHQVDNRKKLAGVIALNIIITISEFIGGMFSGSIALLSDAGHNFSDVLSLMLGYAGEKVSEKNPSKEFTFGLKRFEVLIALINALTLVAIGIFIIYESVLRFMTPQPINLSIMLPVAGIGLMGNFISIVILVKNKDSNLNMKAAFLHLLFDTLSSVAVIAGAAVIYFTNFIWIDSLISLIIVLMIFWSSIDIIKESLRIFMQGTPDYIDTDDVYRNILTIENISSVHGLHIWSINSTEIFLSCHLCTDQYDKNIDTNRLIQDVNSMLEKNYNIKHTTIQVEAGSICNIESGFCKKQ